MTEYEDVTYEPKGATAIVMNPNTGAILALANWPDVDSNSVSGANWIGKNFWMP